MSVISDAIHLGTGGKRWEMPSEFDRFRQRFYRDMFTSWQWQVVAILTIPGIELEYTVRETIGGVRGIVGHIECYRDNNNHALFIKLKGGEHDMLRMADTIRELAGTNSLKCTIVQPGERIQSD